MRYFIEVLIETEQKNAREIAKINENIKSVQEETNYVPNFINNKVDFIINKLKWNNYKKTYSLDRN